PFWLATAMMRPMAGRAPARLPACTFDGATGFERCLTAGFGDPEAFFARAAALFGLEDEAAALRGVGFVTAGP
ncbi:MAG: hypothetical protein WD670_10670, partial [Actinomycetota bacterium]